jgi:hypothetical protein
MSVTFRLYFLIWSCIINDQNTKLREGLCHNTKVVLSNLGDTAGAIFDSDNPISKSESKNSSQTQFCKYGIILQEMNSLCFAQIYSKGV